LCMDRLDSSARGGCLVHKVRGCFAFVHGPAGLVGQGWLSGAQGAGLLGLRAHSGQPGRRLVVEPCTKWKPRVRVGGVPTPSGPRRTDAHRLRGSADAVGPWPAYGRLGPSGVRSALSHRATSSCGCGGGATLCTVRSASAAIGGCPVHEVRGRSDFVHGVVSLGGVSWSSGAQRWSCAFQRAACGRRLPTDWLAYGASAPGGVWMPSAPGRRTDASARAAYGPLCPTERPRAADAAEERDFVHRPVSFSRDRRLPRAQSAGASGFVHGPAGLVGREWLAGAQSAGPLGLCARASRARWSGVAGRCTKGRAARALCVGRRVRWARVAGWCAELPGGDRLVMRGSRS
jgi:hypothetical protein